jgi:hypothetical protein
MAMAMAMSRMTQSQTEQRARAKAGRFKPFLLCCDPTNNGMGDGGWGNGGLGLEIEKTNSGNRKWPTGIRIINGENRESESSTTSKIKFGWCLNYLVTIKVRNCIKLQSSNLYKVPGSPTRA